MPSQLLNLKKQLQWSDFGAPVKTPAPGPGQRATAALTRSNYTISLNAEHIPGTKPPRFRLKDDVRISVVLKRPPSFVASWTLQQASAADQTRILHHEQGHYDLVALLVRDMFIDLMQLKQNTYDTAQAVMTDVAKVRALFDPKFQPINDRYDAANETDHGLNQPGQKRWDGFIQTAFTQPRNPPMQAPDGTMYKTPILTVLQQAGITI